MIFLLLEDIEPAIHFDLHKEQTYILYYSGSLPFKTKKKVTKSILTAPRAAVPLLDSGAEGSAEVEAWVVGAKTKQIEGKLEGVLGIIQ